MDAIKKKMLAMKMDKENAFDRAEQMEQKLRETEEQKAKLEEDLNTLQKKYSNLENEYDKANEGLIEANTKLEASEKRVNEAPDLSASAKDDVTSAQPVPADTGGCSGPRPPSPTQPLDFITPSGSGDPHKQIGHSCVVGSPAAKGSRDANLCVDWLGTGLSQDSQISSSTLSLSQDLSQGSQLDLMVETMPIDGTNGLPAEGTKTKRKGQKKGKKKKPRSRDQPKDTSRSPASSATVSPVHSDSSQNANYENKRDKSNNNDNTSKSNSHKSNNKQHRHKSSKSEKKTKKSSNVPRRPEPEGGNMPSISASEFDRIINSNEPLFSDVDVSGEEELTAAPPPQQPHRQSRLRAAAIAATAGGGGMGGGASSFGVVGIFIPCSQLGMNSNTMIKYAIIGSELQNVFQVSNRVSPSCQVFVRNPV